MTLLQHGTFIFFWILQIGFAIACFLGPLISSAANGYQKLLQNVLMVVLGAGILLTPPLYFAALYGENVPGAIKSPLSTLLWKLLPTEVLTSPWLCLISPFFLIGAAALVFLISYFN